MKKRSILEIIAIAILALILSMVVLQVISRYVFNYPIEWSEEMARFLFIWLGFISAAVALKEDQHVKFTFIIDILPQKARRIIDIFNDLLTMAFLIVLIIYGVMLTINTHSIPSVTLDFIRWSYVYASLPIGFSFLLIILVSKRMKNRNIDKDKEVDGSSL